MPAAIFAPAASRPTAAPGSIVAAFPATVSIAKAGSVTVSFTAVHAFPSVDGEASMSSLRFAIFLRSAPDLASSQYSCPLWPSCDTALFMSPEANPYKSPADLTRPAPPCISAAPVSFAASPHVRGFSSTGVAPFVNQSGVSSGFISVAPCFHHSWLSAMD